jgi:site-specific DNA recombinase
MLSNEKYTGKVLMLKTYGDKYPNNKRHANNGEVQQYMVNDSHPIIISEEQFELIKNEKIRRSNIQKNESGAIRKSTRYSMKKSEDISE